MEYIEALQEYTANGTSLFLAGGIVGCPDWQREMTLALHDTPLVLFNPRRSQYQFHEGAAQEQITWEHMHLRKATAISFWFPKETLCPIVLYELGAWSMTDKKLFIGVHPEYQRIEDIYVQTALVRPDIRIATNPGALAQEIVSWSNA